MPRTTSDTRTKPRAPLYLMWRDRIYGRAIPSASTAMGDGDFQPANILTRSLLLRACVQASSKGMKARRPPRCCSPAAAASSPRRQPPPPHLSAGLRGRCYCGAVRFVVRTDATPIRATFCHCESCRRAHSAPLYQVCYVKPSDFAVTAGRELLKAPPRPHGYRHFCSECGTRICNVMTKGIPRTGFFPSTLEAKDQSILPTRFRPELHHCPEEQVGYLRRHLLPEDGLPRQPCIYVAETRG